MVTTWNKTRASGFVFENELHSLISQYTKHIWRNVSVNTLLTVSGFTEIDLMFVYRDIVYIIEAKNVLKIEGRLQDTEFLFTGANYSSDKNREYRAMNTVTQNNIHLKSLKDAFYLYYNVWLKVVPIIIVPDNCVISEELHSYIFTINQLDDLLSTSYIGNKEDTVHRKLNMLINDNKIYRKDFIFDESIHKYRKVK